MTNYHLFNVLDELKIKMYVIHKDIKDDNKKVST